ALLALKRFGEPVDYTLVKIITTQVSIPRRGLDFKDALPYFEDRDIERAATEVEDQHGLTGFFVQAVGQCRSRRLIDDAQHIQAGNLPGVSRSGALSVVEIGRHGNDRICDFLPQVLRGVLHQLAQHHGGNLFGRVLLALDVKAYRTTRARDDFEGHVLDFVLDLLVAAANEPFGRIDGV